LTDYRADAGISASVARMSRRRAGTKRLVLPRATASVGHQRATQRLGVVRVQRLLQRHLRHRDVDVLRFQEFPDGVIQDEGDDLPDPAFGRRHARIGLAQCDPVRRLHQLGVIQHRELDPVAIGLRLHLLEIGEVVEQVCPAVSLVACQVRDALYSHGDLPRTGRGRCVLRTPDGSQQLRRLARLVLAEHPFDFCQPVFDAGLLHLTRDDEFHLIGDVALHRVASHRARARPDGANAAPPRPVPPPGRSTHRRR
jgi:hypothetical protein